MIHEKPFELNSWGIAHRCIGHWPIGIAYYWAEWVELGSLHMALKGNSSENMIGAYFVEFDELSRMVKVRGAYDEA